MSKFFQALGTVDAASAGIDLPFSDEELKSSARQNTPAAPVTETAVQEIAPEPKPQALAVTVPEAPCQPAPGLSGQIRTLSIRVPADVPVLPYEGSHSHASERYRIIRTRLVQHPRKPRVLAVSSATMGDGKTVMAVNLAGSLALKKDTTALLIDIDFRRGRVASLLGLNGRPGLAEVLAGTCSIHDAVVNIAELPTLYFLPAGDCPQNATELLDSERWRNVLAAFRKEFTFTILDSPPVGIVADYDLIQASADGVVMVARPEHTNRKQLLNAIQVVPKDKLLGVVVNCETEWFLWKSAGAYEGHYAYAPNGAE